MCFGDPLFTPALTNMALLSRGQETDYIDFWCERLGLTAFQGRVLTVYTAIFCVDFLGEQGQQFNQAIVPEIDHAEIASLLSILDRLLAAV